MLGVACHGVAQTVVPIDWDRFTTPELTPFQERIRTVSNRLAGYNLNWIDQNMQAVPNPATPSGRRYDMVQGNEREIRTVSHTVYGAATLLKTGAYDAGLTGFDEQTFRNRTIEMIHGAALEHKSNASGVQWGDVWQSALWTANLAEGAWMMWDELPTETQGLVTNMVVHEANRFVNYNVPYWTSANGTVNTPGDTKAEENAWNSRVLSVAVAMMPEHQNSTRWRAKGSELLVSSFARPSDLTNQTVLDGQAVKSWIKGYNADELGFVQNHGRTHNDYHATTGLTIQPFITQSLANQTVPESAGFNANTVYDAMASIPVGPLKQTMFQRGPSGEYLPDQYYPEGTTWSLVRYDIYLEMDYYAKQFGYDSGKPYDSAGWSETRLARIEEMQNRFPTGKIYDNGEFDSWVPREAYALQTISNIWLVDWLKSQDQLQGQGNWIDTLPSAGGNHLSLIIDRETGESYLVNDARMSSVALDGYAVRSASGQLDPTHWTSLNTQGNGTWLAINSSSTQMGEFKDTGSIVVEPGVQLSLGRFFAPTTPTSFGDHPHQDLLFEYTTEAGQVLQGKVIYLGEHRNVTLNLVVDPETGRAELRNETAFTVQMEGYRIVSASGALVPGGEGWTSLADQQIDDGNWLEANPSPHQLAELHGDGATTIAPGATLVMGYVFDASRAPDLGFQFVLAGESQVRQGTVIYETVQLPGDFNNDGTVNLADYTWWRDTLGQVGINLPADANRDGTITAADYAIWRSHFGDTRSSSLIATLGSPVPCPSASYVAIIATMATAGRSLQSRWFGSDTSKGS